MHICTLEEDDDILWKLPRNASLWKLFIRSFRRATLVSKRNPRCRVYFKSNAAIAFERKRHIRSNLLHIIHPLSAFRMVWETGMVLVFFLALVFNPLDAAYSFNTEEDKNNIEGIMDFMVDILCMIDIVLTFYTGYTIDKTKEVVLDPRTISFHYVSTLFIVDILSSIPTEMLTYIYESVGNDDYGIPYIRLISVLKIFRLNTFLNYLDRAADTFGMHENALKVVRYIALTFLLTHWMACIHYYIPQIRYYIVGEELSESTWIVQAGLKEEANVWVLHGHSLFRATCFLLCTTHAIFAIETNEDAIVGIISYLVGNIFISYMVVMILQMLLSVSSSETKYNSIINQLQQYMRHKQLPLPLQKRLISFYEYRFQKAYFRETVITQTVSEKLRIEINVHCCRRLVDSVSIFKDLPFAVVADVVSKLKAEVFLPNDIIVRAGTVGDSMYFLAYGTVSVETPTGKEICHLQDGAYFGEISLVLLDQKRVANIIAIEICEVYRLDRQSFLMCFSACPEIYRKIKYIADERMQQTVVLEEFHKKYLDEKTLEVLAKQAKSETGSL